MARGPEADTLYASWNRAIEIARWPVLGGPERSSSRRWAGGAQQLALAVALRAGFETAITVPRPPAYLAVEALDDGGTVLGRSAVYLR